MTTNLSLASFIYTVTSTSALGYRVRRSRRAAIVGEAAFTALAAAVAFARATPGALLRRLGQGWAVSVPLQRAAAQVFTGRNVDALPWSRTTGPRVTTYSPLEARATIIRRNLPTLPERFVQQDAALHLAWEATDYRSAAASEQIAHAEQDFERDTRF